MSGVNGVPYPWTARPSRRRAHKALRAVFASLILALRGRQVPSSVRSASILARADKTSDGRGTDWGLGFSAVMVDLARLKHNMGKVVKKVVIFFPAGGRFSKSVVV